MKLNQNNPNIGYKWLEEQPWWWEGSTWTPGYACFYIKPGTQFEFDFEGK